jgi:hypothetical protein
MQLDIFEHSRDLMLRNDVLHALQRSDAAAARTAMAQLQAEYPHDAALPDLVRLLHALEQPAASAFADHAAAAQTLRQLRDELAPAAQRLLGSADGNAWMQPVWRQSARQGAALEFRAEQADDHAAALWLLAGDAASAATAVERIESWRRITAPLEWMCEARWRLQGLDASWGLLAELAWLAPTRLDALLRCLADPLLLRLRRQFDAGFEAEGDAPAMAWFPAWVLTEKPALAPLLGQAQPGLQTDAERAMRLLLDLLHLERQGRQRDLVEQRRRLRDLQPALFRAYMATR